MSIERTSYLLTRLKLQSLHEAAIKGDLLIEGYSLKRLLFEEFSGDEEKELMASLKQVDTILQKLGQQSKSKEFQKLVIQPILKADAKIPRDASDQKAVADFSRAVQDIAEEAAKVISVLGAMKEDITKLIEKEAPDADPKKTIGEILEENDLDAAKGLEAAYQTPDWFTKAWGAGAKSAEKEAEGMFGKIKGFFKSLFKGKSTVKIKPSNIQKGLMSITIEALEGLNIDAAQKQLIGATKEASAGTTDITGTAMAGGGEGGEGGGATEEEVKEVEKASMGFKELIAALAEYDPEAAQKKIKTAADSAGVKPDDLKKIVQEPEAVDDMAEENEDLDPEAIEQAMADAAEEMEEEGVGEEVDEEESDPSDEIEAAADGASPAAALGTMYDDWTGSLSKSSMGALDAKNRGADLKSGMVGAVGTIEGDLESAIQQAVADWRSENEEKLVDSGKFAADNFEALEDLVPDLAVALLKRGDESRFVLTVPYVNRFVHRSLDKIAGEWNLNSSLSRLNELAGFAPTSLLEQSFDDEAKEKIEPVLDAAAAEVAAEFEADAEQAEADLEEPAKQMGGKVDGADLALGLKMADEGDSEDLYTALEDGEADPDKVVDVLKDLPKDLKEDDPEDNPGDVESIVDKAVSGAEDPEENEEAVKDALVTAIEDWEDSLTDRQKKRVNAKGRLGDLKQGVEDATPPAVEDPVDPQDVAKVGDDWAKKNKIDDPKSPLGNPKNFSPKEMQKLIDLFPEIVDEVQGEEGEEGEGAEELADAAKELLDKYEEFEEENPEAAEEALAEPAEELGVDAAKLVDLLDNPEDLEAAAEEEEVKPEDLAAALETATDEVAEGGDEEGGDEEISDAAQALLDQYEELAADDPEKAFDALEGASEELDIDPPKLADLLDDPEGLADAAKEAGADTDEVVAAFETAEEEVAEAQEEGDEGSEELESALADLKAAYDELAAEDEELAQEFLEEIADELGVSPEEMAEMLSDPEAVQDEIEEDEIDVDAFIDSLGAAEEEISEAEPGEGGDEEADPEAADPSDEIEAEMQSDAPVKGAIATALDNWIDSLEDEAKEEIDPVFPSLRDAVFGAIDKSGDGLQQAVKDEIAAWRGEHEETLVKGKKFAKKNFQSLEDLAPEMAAAILKKSDEAVGVMTRSTVRKAVHGYLDRKFFGQHDLLNERFVRRMNKLAGLL